jgi:arylsulfatase A-like enzyme
VPWAGNTAVRAGNFFQPLGEKSFLFHRACITQPVCTPSRGSIMTGRWPHRHGNITNNVKLRPDCRTIAEYLRAEYTTA